MVGNLDRRNGMIRFIGKEYWHDSDNIISWKTIDVENKDLEGFFSDFEFVGIEIIDDNDDESMDSDIHKGMSQEEVNKLLTFE